MQISAKAQSSIEQFKLPKDLGFGTVMSPIMVECDYKDGVWSEPIVSSYGPLFLDPTTKALHYAQEIFEGMKAYNFEGNGPYLFRPIENFKRFNFSAKRMAMAEVPENVFMDSVKEITRLSKNFIPKNSGESLYIRPFMFATQVHLGIKPSTHLKFMVVASPSGAYFSSSSLKLYIERESVRAVPGGTGCVKTGGNYAASLQSMVTATEKGYDQVLWLDAIGRDYVEELSGMNVFFLYGNELHTPELTDTILAGITRDSIIKIAPDLGLKVVERKMSITELLADVKAGKCTGGFACGTASIIAPIASFPRKTWISY